MESFILLYLLFKTLPKGKKIDKPNRLVICGEINDEVAKLLHLEVNLLYFTQRTIKHLAEKSNDELVKLINSICARPDEVRKGNGNRYLLIKYIKEKSGRPYAICIEVVRDTPTTIITVFPSNFKYLSNFDLLWRTGAR